ncbi:MAG: phosphoglycerate kinase [Flexilinea sp.]
MEIKMRSLKGVELAGKKVLLRPDINSPINPESKKIINDERIIKTIPVIRELLDGGASVAIIAHQGDTLDYQNLIGLEEHAVRLSELLGIPVEYIDDVCGPAAIERVKILKPGEVVILGNLRYLTEEVSTFEKDVKLDAAAYTKTWEVRKLASLFNLYVNEAFSAAHRNSPSMVAFQELLPTAAGPLLFTEYEALSKVLHGAIKPTVFVLGGAKISDAYGMMKTVLANGTADKILTSGVTGLVMLYASGIDVGEKTVRFLKDKDLLGFVEESKEYLRDFPEKIVMPVDVAYEENGKRMEMDVADMPKDTLYPDVGQKTIDIYAQILADANTIFANGPAGVYEKPIFEKGTRGVWQAIADSKAYSVIGGGDTISSAGRFIDMKQISYVCTGGGAMIRFMSGKKLPLIEAMEKAYERDSKKL